MNIRIGGTATGLEYDQLIVMGNATIDGTLRVSVINNFVPTSASTFQIMLFQSLMGVFATTNIDPRFVSSPIYDSMDVTIQAA